MIVLFTDFGSEGPYLGQMQAVLHRRAPGLPQVSLCHDLAPFAVQESAYLLAAYAPAFPADCVFLCVVDPGVGGDRDAVIVETQSAGQTRWFVGPGNGLFALVARFAEGARAWRITWQPEQLSRSFHGRDLFAPVAAQLARDLRPPEGCLPAPEILEQESPGTTWPDDLPRVIYLDRYGNAMTGLRAKTAPKSGRLTVAGKTLRAAGTFSDVAPGQLFWYENANGLVEIAANRANARQSLALAVGDPVAWKD